MIKTSSQKFKYPENGKSLVDIKAFLISFKGLAVAKNWVRPDSVPLKAFFGLNVKN